MGPVKLTKPEKDDAPKAAKGRTIKGLKNKRIRKKKEVTRKVPFSIGSQLHPLFQSMSLGWNPTCKNNWWEIVLFCLMRTYPEKSFQPCLRLNLLLLGGAPYSILSIVQLVMQHMTMPTLATLLQLVFDGAFKNQFGGNLCFWLAADRAKIHWQTLTPCLQNGNGFVTYHDHVQLFTSCQKQRLEGLMCVEKYAGVKTVATGFVKPGCMQLHVPTMPSSVSKNASANQPTSKKLMWFRCNFWGTMASALLPSSCRMTSCIKTS